MEFNWDKIGPTLDLVKLDLPNSKGIQKLLTPAQSRHAKEALCSFTQHNCNSKATIINTNTSIVLMFSKVKYVTTAIYSTQE